MSVAGQELGKLTAEVNQLRAAEALQLDEIAQIGKDSWLDVSGNGVYMGISRYTHDVAISYEN